MSSVLIVGGDHIDGIKQVLSNYGADHVHHWPGRKAGDSNKVIPQDTKAIVLITDWISHAFTHKVKKYANKRGIKVIYTHNGAKALHGRLEQAGPNFSFEGDCLGHAYFYSTLIH